jgi:hypothetical protein
MESHIMNIAILLSLVCLAVHSDAAAQDPAGPFQAGAQLGFARSGQFDSSEIGFGGRVSWNPLASIGVEAEINVYPQDFPDGLAFSGPRVEGLFGATAGPRFDRVRPFARLRGGFLHYSGRPVVCVAIFPPPLNCLMAAGGHRQIVDLGGGLEVFTGARTFVRVDAGDRMVRYPGPTFVNGIGERKDEGFFGHDFRVAVGGGLRF